MAAAGSAAPRQGPALQLPPVSKLALEFQEIKDHWVSTSSFHDNNQGPKEGHSRLPTEITFLFSRFILCTTTTPLTFRFFLLCAQTAKSDSSSSSNYTVYRLVVKCAGAQPPVWEVYRRYQEFRDLRRQLNTIHGCTVPALPPKRPFGVMDETFIKGREADLTMWMRDLVTSAAANPRNAVDPMRTQAMVTFLTVKANQPPRIKEKVPEKTGDWGKH
jgi:hypothetical protein